ncbi:nucleobase:cation symporter-2 family protein [Propioniciclava soli]|uniref:nucleobase:cation symporter-2 family protein n=1 Tax=Propioniciclava soli TaxID=2775081 RepID=UPI001E5984B8|nr:nucleobase:cation symporter-2 family protein [Propioniciclava soli]
MTTTLDPVTEAPPARPEDEKLPLPTLLGAGLQHILAMFGGVIAVPLIIGGAAGLEGPQIALLVSCSLFVSGLATVLQTVGVPWFGSQLPLVQGISFASVSTLLTVVAGNGAEGMRAAFGATLVAALVCLAIVPFFAQVVRFFPPVVTGSIITVIGLSLMPVAAGWVTGQATLNGAPNPNYASGANLALALVTLAVVLVLSKIRATSRMAILLGLLIGTVIALFTGQATWNLAGAAPFALPQPFAFGTPTFALGAIIAMTVVMVVVMVETTADILAVGEVIGTHVDSRRVSDGLRADMLSSAVAPVFNTFPATAFAQNVGLLALSGIRSRWAVAAGGVVLALLGLSPMLAAVVRVIPSPVLGGVGIALFGTVAASGIRTLSKVNYQGNQNLLIVAVAIAFGLLPDLSPSFWHSLPEGLMVVVDSGISAAAIVAVVLNLVFNVWAPGRPPEPSHLAAAPPRLVQEGEMEMLSGKGEH